MRPTALGILTAIVAGVVVVAGCGASGGSSPSGAPLVQLLTGPDPNAVTHLDSCSNGYADGILVDDPEAGTAVVDATIGSLRVPLMWPSGYTARAVGGGLELARPDGATFAKTGNRYWFQGSYVGDVFYACGFVLPE